MSVILLFIGINTDANEGFSFITLTDIPSSEEIYFIDRGVRDASNWNAAGPEGIYLFTAPPTGISCGTIVTFEETAPNVIAISGVSGASYVAQAGSGDFNLGSGDQLLAYQFTGAGFPLAPSDATFIAAIHAEYNVGCLDALTRWNETSCVTSTSESVVPPGLENGTNCLSMTPSGPEIDNARYTGTLTGTSTVLRGLINDYNNWETNDGPVYDLTSTGYATPAVTCIPVPVELVSFKVQKMNSDKIELSWITATEINNDFFTVERSQDSNNWEELEFVKGVGNSTGELNYYQTTDDQPFSGTSYYRLKQTDFDGQFEYSSIKAISLNNQIRTEISVFPNPASNHIKVKSNVDLQENELEVYNFIGQKVNHIISISTEGAYVFNIDISKLESGLYILKTTTINQMQFVLKH